ncbi:class I SAM-dependent methyltransferase [Actomonas aquatica]|uniref:Class I SAM-dependent methyltransferase n=1 Tax=Actomonas aquatica TaxID=2866162 RepID=A0ABZ1C9Y8_9BACT|nr:class I SAM-dependent methyltransferase [Opitutus sp. WL0086]WRQ88465.1 class I SAM-dependent methyltransferase [Opitutus sp. WL0086]
MNPNNTPDRSSVPCPCCQTDCAAHRIRRYRCEEAAAYFCPPTRDEGRHLRLREAISSLWPDGHASIHTCPGCGFGFAFPHVGGNEQFYQTLHEQAGYPADRWDYEEARQCQAFLDTPGRVLDIGAGFGAFLAKLPAGWEPHAIESSPTMRTHLEQREVTVHPSSASAKQQGRFKVITLFQVLEHLAPFRPILQDAAAMLEPGGWLFITVPDGEMMTEQERRLGSPDMPPNHVNRWTPSSLAAVLKELGLMPAAPTVEPGRPGLVLKRLHLLIMQRAASSPRSLSAAVYRLQSRKVRAVIMGFLAIGFALKHLPNLGWMSRGGAFALAARKPA